jgi:ATP-dependent Clp protease ATP-binding subunit ClpC
MFERFSDNARRVVVLAQEQARVRDHEAIGTAHLLLGLTQEPECSGSRILAAVGITLLEVRSGVEASLPRGEPSSGRRQIPFLPEAKKALELSLREAVALGDRSIGTQHILLALIREQTGVGGHVLRALRVTPDRARREMARPAGQRPDPVGPAARFTARGFEPATCFFCGTPSPECGTLFRGAGYRLICERCVTTAREQSGGEAVGA